MTGALSFLNDLAQWLARWIPRMVLIQPTHRGVLFGPRGSARELGPGLRVYWPITHALVLMPVTMQSMHLCSQMLPLNKDLIDAGMIPRVRLCATAIQFRVGNPVLAATASLHPHALIDNRSGAAVMRHHAAHSDDLAKWSAAVLADIHEEMLPYGVLVEQLDFTGYAVGVALKNVSDWNYQDGVDGKRPSA